MHARQYELREPVGRLYVKIEAATAVAGIASSSVNRTIDIDKIEIVVYRTIFKRGSG